MNDAVSIDALVAAAGKTFTDLAGIFGARQIAAVARLGTFDSIASTKFSPATPVLRREFVRRRYTANVSAAQVQAAPAAASTP